MGSLKKQISNVDHETSWGIQFVGSCHISLDPFPVAQASDFTIQYYKNRSLRLCKAEISVQKGSHATIYVTAQNKQQLQCGILFNLSKKPLLDLEGTPKETFGYLKSDLHLCHHFDVSKPNNVCAFP